jgi:hypothetical protein
LSETEDYSQVVVLVCAPLTPAVERVIAEFLALQRSKVFGIARVALTSPRVAGAEVRQSCWIAGGGVRDAGIRQGLPANGINGSVYEGAEWSLPARFSPFGNSNIETGERDGDEGVRL